MKIIEKWKSFFVHIFFTVKIFLALSKEYFLYTTDIEIFYDQSLCLINMKSK